MSAADSFAKGVARYLAGDRDGAALSYREAIKTDPKHADAYTNLGVVFHSQALYHDAIEQHRLAIKINPRAVAARVNLAIALNELRRYDEALDFYAAAVEIDPDNAVAYCNCAHTLINVGRYDEAEQNAQKALRLRPDYPDAHCNLGLAYWGMGRNIQAIGACSVALSLQSNHPVAHRNLGVLLLQQGKYVAGWNEFEWRWVAESRPRRPFTKPLWNGQIFDGELLIWGEQGLGDQILQASMLADLVDCGHEVVWEADPRLVPLLRRSAPGQKVVSADAIKSEPRVRVVPRETPPVDVGRRVRMQLPAGSLGRIFRGDKDAFPKSRRSYLKADNARKEEFRERMNLKPGEALVGISWASRSVVRGDKKTIPLDAWGPIFSTSGARFVDLQYGDTAGERAASGTQMAHFDDPDLMDDVDGVAALIAACDAVVTVSNVTAHLAGALGVPTWVIVTAGSGRLWYWGDDSVEVPLWYPSVRIVHQRHGEPIASCIDGAEEQLRIHLGIRSSVTETVQSAVA